MSDALNRLTAAVARVGVGIGAVAAKIKADHVPTADDSADLNNLATQLEGFGQQLQDIASAETVTTSDATTSTNGTAEQTSDTAGNEASTSDTSGSTIDTPSTSGSSEAEASTSSEAEQATAGEADATA